MPVDPLDSRALYTHCDLSVLDFDTTDQVLQLVDSFGQARAEDAIRFGVDIRRPGYNLFVLGTPGSGRHTAVRRLVDSKAAAEPPAGDWCYINNFAEPNKPRLLPLPAGRGAQLRHDMQKFGTDLATAIRTSFESEEYRQRIDAIQEEFKQREEEAMRALGKDAGEQGIALLRTPHGFAFAPMKGEEAMDPEAFAQLPDADKERIGKLMEEFGARLHKLVHQFPRWQREMQQRIRQTNREATSLAVGHLIEELKEHYTDLVNVLFFLDEVLQDVVLAGETREEPKTEDALASVLMSGNVPMQRYQVNLLVDHRGALTAPVVYEDNPNYQNLIGRIDYTAQLGTLVTNYTMIKGAALHRANGGYLIVDAFKVLTQPFAWEALKRALKSAQVRIESPAQWYGLSGTVPLEAEPMPLEVKVVLVGERLVYYLLQEYDPEFEELFKVAADFEDDVARSAENTRMSARLIATLVRRHELRPFEKAAVARIIEHSARRAGDAEKLSTGTRWVSNLLCEADYLANQAAHTVVGCEHVEQALAAQHRRADRLCNSIQDAVLRETLLIATAGSHVGQINGLAVIDLGDFRFAHPVRITATARIGEGDVIDIEREAELGGAIHSKGVMILSSFLAARYSQHVPLCVAASLVFEQSYGPVEGDSASLAELCALLSALSGAAVKQSLAVTGSVNQYGRVQAIGAVNEKIEGFFDICKARGQLEHADGAHGVIIPESNVKDLMLREDVVAAVREDKFRIYAVSDVDQAIELLTGLPAGEPDQDGAVAAGTVNYMVATKLAEMSTMRQQFAGGRKQRGKTRKS